MLVQEITPYQHLYLHKRSNYKFRPTTHQDSKHIVPHDESEAVDLHGNQLGYRHHLSVHNPVPLLIFYLNGKVHQVGTFQSTTLGQCISAGPLEIKFFTIKSEVMGVTSSLAYTLANRVAFLDTIFYFTLLIRATCELLALNLGNKQTNKKKKSNQVSKKPHLND